MQIRLFIAPLLLLALFSFAEEESKWEETIQKFEKLDVEIPPPENPVLFVGSSSIVFWRTLASDMAPLNVLNRGFGGSRMFELNEFRDRIVTNYNPKAIVIYEGDKEEQEVTQR